MDFAVVAMGARVAARAILHGNCFAVGKLTAVEIMLFNPLKFMDDDGETFSRRKTPLGHDESSFIGSLHE